MPKWLDFNPPLNTADKVCLWFVVITGSALLLVNLYKLVKEVF